MRRKHKAAPRQSRTTFVTIGALSIVLMCLWAFLFQMHSVRDSNTLPSHPRVGVVHDRPRVFFPPRRKGDTRGAEDMSALPDEFSVYPSVVEDLASCVTDEDVSEELCVIPDIQFRTKWKVFIAPQDNSGKGWRFYHLVTQGVDMHPFLHRTQTIADADVVLWLPTSTSLCPPGLNRDLARIAAAGGSHPGSEASDMTNATAFRSGLNRLVVLDEADGPGHYPPAAKEPYAAYFKRSWVSKRNGVYRGHPKRLKNNYFPLAYSSSDAYHAHLNGSSSRFAGSVAFEGLAKRGRDVVCSLRCHERQPTRCKVLEWVKAAARALDLRVAQPTKAGGTRTLGPGSVLGEVNFGGRKEINAAYFSTMREARIVVTCNPSHWEGDFRLFEAMMSGALVFVDQMWAPMPHPFLNGTHVILYSTEDQGDFTAKLRYYHEHPLEARKIAKAGYLHTLRFHRSLTRMDFVMRSTQDASEHELHQQRKATSDRPSSPLVRRSSYQHTGLSILNNHSMAMFLDKKPQNWKR